MKLSIGGGQRNVCGRQLVPWLCFATSLMVIAMLYHGRCPNQYQFPNWHYPPPLASNENAPHPAPATHENQQQQQAERKRHDQGVVVDPPDSDAKAVSEKVQDVPLATVAATTPKVEPVTAVEFVDIIGIGIYTWHHLLNGTLDVSDAGKESYTSSKEIDGICFNFLLKCCKPSPPVDLEIEHRGPNLIVALWGRSGGRGNNLALIRRLLADDSIRNLALIVFGDIDCNDSYLNEFTTHWKLRFVYVTHESKAIDDKKVFLWPLGTQMAADHKVRHNSPYVRQTPISLDLAAPRKYTSNFLGSVWPRRQPMADTIKKHKELFDNDRHLLSFASRWNEQKKEIVGDRYEYSLLNSDLTLSPRGMAAECYRTFEALELGSIPVVSNMVEKPCQDARFPVGLRPPNRVFKLHDAPVYYVNDWERDLPVIIADWDALSDEDKASKRREVHDWYLKFKADMGRMLLHHVRTRFL